MKRKNGKEYYVQIYGELKSTYEWWGIDMMSMFDHIRRDCPNVALAIHKMYTLSEEPNYYQAKFHVFSTVKYVYEAIANLIPAHNRLQFDTFTKELSEEYATLNMLSWHRFVPIQRIDLLMAILLFTEDFIFLPITDKCVIYEKNSLTVYSNFVTFKIKKKDGKTFVSIKIRNVILFTYVILN